MDIKNKKILLVGGCGFIGHNLALYLKERNADPYILDSLSINNLYSIDNEEVKNKNLYSAILNNRIDLLKEKDIKLIIQDARDYQSISRIYDKIDPDIIIHLAAVSHANKSNKDPHNTFDHSLRTLENTLDFARNKKKHLIYLSSSMVYGNFDGKEVDEDTVCNPIGIYGTLKLSGELLVKAYNQCF
jgi:nucleoside-diphosphate-sugar epimerase